MENIRRQGPSLRRRVVIKLMWLSLLSNRLEDGGRSGVSGTLVATAEDSDEHEKEGINQTDSVLTNDCDNVHINAVNTLSKHKEINVREIECMNGETEGHVRMDDGNVKQQGHQFL